MTCQKCGSLRLSGPRWIRQSDVLQYTCLCCGWTLDTAPLDRRREAGDPLAALRDGGTDGTDR